MKFIKANLTLVICGAVVVLSLVAWLVWPLPSLKAEVQADLSDRYDDVTAIGKIMDTPLALPDQPLVKGPPSAAYVEVKRELITDVNAQKTQVEQLSHERNAAGRVTARGVPVLPTVELRGNTVSWGKEEPNYLPRIRGANPFAFKSDYGEEFHQWASLLATGKLVSDFNPADGAPPTADSLRADFAQLEKNRQASMGPAGGPGGSGAPSDPQEELKYDKDKLVDRAKNLYMYVDPGAFQIRPWLDSAEQPTDEQIFVALVDSWLQADVVRAISTLNNTAGRSDHDISKSAVKRLFHITVGNSARVHTVATSLTSGGAVSGVEPVPDDSSFLFYTTSDATTPVSGAPVMGPAVNGGGAAAVQPAAPNKIDYSVGMTGHASGGDYDVVLMSIWVDIDPAQLLSFMNELYRQNVGYTVIDLQLKTVDPLDRASNGYLYGDSQAVEAEIQVEAVLFRSWTTPLMPARVRSNQGVTTPVP